MSYGTIKEGYAKDYWFESLLCRIFGHRWVLRGWGLQAHNRNERTYNCDRCHDRKETR